ncbi:MAG: hypothetical protein DMD61_11830 [Gemmatimonadetes bacterium]|nr:MAG: hypothetical protein DMD61_11830 [Gemmatimonadota bacterium]
MPRIIFWDVDTQYDFMHADGKLYVPEAERIVGNLKRLTDYAHAHGIRIVASADDHVTAHPEISDAPDWATTFPPHCNPNVGVVLDVLAPDDIVLYGVATDVCDKAAVEGLLERRPRTRLFVVTDAVRGIDKDVSEQLLKDWGDEGVRLVRTKEVVEEGLVEELARATA